MDDKGLPDSSAWATKLGCGARVWRPEIVDTKAGYVYDSTSQCKNGRVVADLVRAGKGHTEGLEPPITEQLIQMMFSTKC